MRQRSIPGIWLALRNDLTVARAGPGWRRVCPRVRGRIEGRSAVEVLGCASLAAAAEAVLGGAAPWMTVALEAKAGPARAGLVVALPGPVADRDAAALLLWISAAADPLKPVAMHRVARAVHHETANAFTGIMGFARLMAQRLEPGSSLREKAEHIHAAASRASRLPGLLVGLGGDRRPQAGPEQLGEIVGSMVPVLRRMIEPRIPLAVDVAPYTPRVRIDRRAVEWIMFVLALAAEGVEAGRGRLAVRTAWVEVGPRGLGGLSQGEYGVLRVALESTLGSRRGKAGPAPLDPAALAEAAEAVSASGGRFDARTNRGGVEITVFAPRANG